MTGSLQFEIYKYKYKILRNMQELQKSRLRNMQAVAR